MATITPVQGIQEEFLSTIRKGQDTVIESIRTWVGTVQSVTPPLPTPSIPFAEYLPKPEELVAGAYDFAEALLASQRKFAEDVLKVTAGMFPPEGKPAASASASRAAAAK